MVLAFKQIFIIKNEFPKILNLIFKTNWNRREKWWPLKISIDKDLESSKLFKSKSKSLRVICFFTRTFQKNKVLRLQQLMQASFSHYQAPSKRPKPRRFKCSTPGFKYHLSIIPLNTFQAFWTHPNRGCLSHCFRHNPQCLRVSPSLNLDTKAV